ncbi:proline--tRNA ligase [Candidatus Woesearchaeota archaeon]|nr:proline--tRNA ligase [Candidatus Woesearchaeota archaeon]
MPNKKEDVGITITKEKDFSEWYQQIIIKSELADYSSVSGCIVFRPSSYAIWEKIKSVIDNEFKKIGVKNAYFPLFIPEKLLSREAEHVEGFIPEVAWVTHSGKTKLQERLAVRPTSEAIMYESYSKWIRSYRDLPLRLNQWNNVVRWEFKHPVPFLRSREFLWNEGHSAYATSEEVLKDRDAVLKIYSDFLKDYMALPGLIGKKTEKEKFAGAVATYSIELMLPNGKAIQGPDYHDDGQNFAKAYNIQFLDENEKKQYVYQSTYAITTRMIGVMLAIHSDNKGIVIPPKLAENKIVIIPILFDKTKEKVLKEAEKLKKELKTFNPILDAREEYNPGWKFNEWELKGIPLRIEIGPKDIEKRQVMIAKRTEQSKIPIKIKDLKNNIPKFLEDIHNELYKRAEHILKGSIVKTENKDKMIKAIKNKNIVLVPLCNEIECQDWIKDKTGGAKTLNMPLDQPSVEGKKCVWCGKAAEYFVYVGKSY